MAAEELGSQERQEKDHQEDGLRRTHPVYTFIRNKYYSNTSISFIATPNVCTLANQWMSGKGPRTKQLAYKNSSVQG